MILILTAGWFVPLCEPGRTSRVVGTKLGELSRRLGIEPVLLEYQEPGVIYALGQPVAMTRDRDGFFAHVAGGRSVATVLLDFEIPVMRSHFGLDVTLVDEVESLELTKESRQTPYLTPSSRKAETSPTFGERPRRRRDRPAASRTSSRS